jgi:inositol-polyphosphate multikinase
LSVARLPEAIAQFFPIRTPILSLSSPTPISEEGKGSTDITVTPSPSGTRPELLLQVLRSILTTVEEIEEAVEKTEMRMIGGSVLIVYEGDELVLETALNVLPRVETAPPSASSSSDRNQSVLPSQPSAVAANRNPPIYAVKVIDFAHTKIQEGLGPDEGVLLGLRTTISLLQGRIKEVQEVIGSSESFV